MLSGIDKDAKVLNDFWKLNLIYAMNWDTYSNITNNMKNKDKSIEFQKISNKKNQLLKSSNQKTEKKNSKNEYPTLAITPDGSKLISGSKLDRYRMGKC